MEPAAPGWGGVLLALAVGAAVGYRAARRGAWGASEEQEEELREAWQAGYLAGESDEAANSHERVEAARWDAYAQGWDGGAWEERKAQIYSARDASQRAARDGDERMARGYLAGFNAAGGASGRARSSTRIGHG